MSKQQIGVVGMAVMGRNLALNIESRGYTVSIFNRSREKTEEVIAENPGKKLVPYYTVQEFVESLETPRRILLMVKAGAGTDSAITSRFSGRIRTNAHSASTAASSKASFGCTLPAASGRSLVRSTCGSKTARTDGDPMMPRFRSATGGPGASGLTSGASSRWRSQECATSAKRSTAIES